MNSIRKHLLTGLLGGLGVLWLVVAVTVNVTVRASLEGAFDAELQTIAMEVRYVLPESGRQRAAKPSAFWFQFFQEKSGLYFEVWDGHLLFSDRSPNLGRQKLPKPAVFAETAHLWNFTLESGEKVRGIAQRFVLAGDRRIHVVVARNRSALDRNLRVLLAATGIAGLLLIPLVFLTVRMAVGRGLRQLQAFDARVAALSLHSLHERFATGDVAVELLPIARRLNELMERLEAGVDRERRLNADLAHELRTPIAELKTMSEVALAWPDQIRGEHYQEVLQVARQMQAVVDGMLLLARCEGGAETPTMEWLNVADLVGGCWRPHGENSQRKQLRVEQRVAPELVVRSNPGLLQIVLGNLLANAVDYTPPNGRVVIEAGRQDGRFCLRVANTSEGIEPQHVQDMFRRFWRRDAARSRGGHSGLGLTLAKTCADALSFDVVAELDEAAGMIVFSVLARDVVEPPVARGEDRESVPGNHPVM